MNFDELILKSKTLHPVLVLEDYISHAKRQTLLKSFIIVSLLSLLLFFFVQFELLESLSVFSPYLYKIRGFFLITLAIVFGLTMLEAFYFSHYDRALQSSSVSFDLANLLSFPVHDDITYLFLSSPYGWEVMDRLEIGKDEVKDYLGTRTEKIQMEKVHFPELNGPVQVDLSTFVSSLYVADQTFIDFLFKHGVSEHELIGATRFVEEQIKDRILAERWWLRENLARIPGLAKNWSYGQTYLLTRYGYDLTEEFTFRKKSGRLLFVRDEVEKLETILSRSREANAFVVGDDEDERLAIIEALAKRIHDGTVIPVLEHKRVFVINAATIIERNTTKGQFETALGSILGQALQTGNTIVVISHFPSLIQNAKTLGSELTTILDPFVQSGGVQLVALCDKSAFHEHIESNTDLYQHFETVLITEKDSNHLLTLIQDEAVEIEKQSGVFFTYQGLEAVVESVGRYFADLPQADKAHDILFELVSFVGGKGNRVIGRAEVLAFVQSKTGIPVGEVKAVEKDKLLHLEEILHQKIVGQNEAITAISQALRRSRSDLRDHAKPIGSFLFLGPTGVGKTETSKALAQVFFGTNAPVIRLDMSEYAGNDAMEKLLGSFGGSKVGVLAGALREHPYGILLLDEFEKAHTEVLNLFLQVLDEGFFSDMRGHKVNARNMIIIATSNAGSDLIFDIVKSGKELLSSKDEIVKTIIERNLFKPELLNRFDGVILFHPLFDEQLQKVATMMLTRVAEDFKKKGYDFRLTNEVIEHLMKKGTDTSFGARPMNRAIAEEVEASVAEAILKGDLKKGSKFELVLLNNHLSVKILS